MNDTHAAIQPTCPATSDEDCKDIPILECLGYKGPCPFPVLQDLQSQAQVDHERAIEEAAE